jgi:hypothetical protein
VVTQRDWADERNPFVRTIKRRPLVPIHEAPTQ